MVLKCSSHKHKENNQNGTKTPECHFTIRYGMCKSFQIKAKPGHGTHTGQALLVVIAEVLSAVAIL